MNSIISYLVQLVIKESEDKDTLYLKTGLIIVLCIVSEFIMR